MICSLKQEKFSFSWEALRECMGLAGIKTIFSAHFGMV
jgi:hypothetical protein